MAGKRQLLAMWGLVAGLAALVLIQALLPGQGMAKSPTVEELEVRVVALEAKLACVTTTVTTLGGNTGREVFFDNCNVHIRNGLGGTNSMNHFGNLIIGYNEDDFSDAVRSGSHNLVIGPDHTYSRYGGLVAGIRNSVTGTHASVSGGARNTASGDAASVSGGFVNVASAGVASVSGGDRNTASGELASVSGGTLNTASGNAVSVSGGSQNTASGAYTSVSGGFQNTASGQLTSVSGGSQNTASGNGGASVSGGAGCAVSFFDGWGARTAAGAAVGDCSP